MLIRLRSRDGLERLEVPDGATVKDLKAKINQVLGVPIDDMFLSKNQALLTARETSKFQDMVHDRAELASLGIQHGDMVYLLYHIERNVQPAYKKTVFESRPFGAAMSVEDLLAKQTRIERQEAAHCASVSFERHAAQVFQAYVNSALAFSIKRGGLLYGTVDEEGNIRVETIYEPPQSGTAHSLQLERGTEEEQRADYIAGLLGLKKVGWIFTQSAAQRDYIMSSEEIQAMAGMQDEVGEHCVTGVVSVAETEEGEGPDVHFEAFAVSDQTVKLVKAGWFQAQEEPSGVSTLRNPGEPQHPRPVIVAGKDQGEVDNDYFLIPVNILDHEGALYSAFPVENRLLPQGTAELRAHLKKFKSRPYVDALSDFHLLLWLAKQLDLTTDMAALATAVRDKSAVPEGYKLIIDSLAEV